jgi:hypothetical protein
MRRIRSRALTVLAVALFLSLLGGVALADPLFPDDPGQTPVPVPDPLPVVDPVPVVDPLPLVDPLPVDPPPPLDFPDDPEHGG